MTPDLSTYERLLHCSSDAIFRIDRKHCYRYANPAASTALGLDGPEIIGRQIAEIGLNPEIKDTLECAILSAFERKEEQSLAFEASMGKRSMHLQASVLPEFDAQGGMECVLVVIHDMSKRERMEKEHEDLLRRERAARVQAETAARARDEFLAIVSHELRAPLNAIQTWAHLLENGLPAVAMPGIAQRAISGIKTGVSQQVRLIEDLLDVTRMMSGKLRLIKHPFALLSAVHAAVQSVTESASAKNISIDCDARINGEKIEGDADRIQQALWNLLSNAVKFTPQGGHIRVAVDCNGSHVLISITDNGIGISPDFLPHLFDRFSQEDTSSTRRHNGLGLGLFVVRHLIEMHGGTVRADSAGEGKGASFTLELPVYSQRGQTISALQPEAGEHGPLPSLAGVRILLIDDQEDARESLSMVLTVTGATVFAAASSTEIFNWLNALAEESFPNMIISDIAMPVEDGYTVLRKLRAWQSSEGKLPLQRVPALALTAFAQREDRIRALTAGFQMHVAKPVAPDELIVAIAMMTARH